MECIEIDGLIVRGAVLPTPKENADPLERQTLARWQGSAPVPAGQARRGQILLLLEEQVPLSHIAKTVGMNRRFVAK